MLEGRIKWYSEKKGYGFVETDNDGEFFLHKSGIADYGFFGLQKDLKVTFEIKQTPKGPHAVNVKPV